MSREQLLSLVRLESSRDRLNQARQSKLMFVRSQDHLSLDSPKATGRKLTAYEALTSYGVEALREVIDYGSAILSRTSEEPASTIARRRESLGLSTSDVAKQTQLPKGSVEATEDKSKRSPIRHLELIAAVLGLDERLISIQAGAGGDDQLAARLKSLGGRPKLSAKFVSALSEAAWVIRTQIRLQEALGIHQEKLQSFVRRDVYHDTKIWEQGYGLAAETRLKLGMDPEAPIDSMRTVCARLHIPLLQTNLPKHCAGATVSSQNGRGIVINTSNQNVWVRRATIAHELGHLLWDPDERLNRVVVDNYNELESFERTDKIESRANAFAISFLAPPDAVKVEFAKHADDASALTAIMQKFGISMTAAKNHVSNAIGRTVDFLPEPWPEPSDDWTGREDFTGAFFPLQSTTEMRRGDFAGIVVESVKANLISVDTASSYLLTTCEDYEAHASVVAEIFGELASQ